MEYPVITQEAIDAVSKMMAQCETKLHELMTADEWREWQNERKEHIIRLAFGDTSE